ncbi:Uncharacterized protein Rv2102 [Geodia barretti]|uniref:Uncharacterized protein Rv2102 n=1 Tax=Geodia barretti TaxID=519541 RepID=A0AA35TA27_GEOBA|nr:Uncharacterized protein Rv2102 [Geodia barretti]
MVYYGYEYTRPREAKGGIRAQSKRGDFGASWWAQRWVQALENFSLGSRLARGRSYARRGQRPYRVSIGVATLPGPDWQRLQAALAERPVFAASLLAGRMPENIEDVFGDVGLSLFPARESDLETDCSCPDYANPCKHIAAVYLLLGEEFDRDPFLIFRMRGIERDELLGPDLRKSVEASAWMAPTLAPEPLPADPDAFWGQPEWDDNDDDLSGPARVPEEVALLPRQLGASRSGRAAKSSCRPWKPSTAGRLRSDWNCTSVRNDPRYRPAEAWMIAHLDRQG